MKGSQKLKYLFFAMIIAAVVGASPIKNWTSGEYVTYSDLNAVLNHLHANLGHGHGPIITAADISPSAAIRPEQTTFGAATNRNLVFEGTFQRNSDGGSAYLPINTGGTLSVTVASNAATVASSSGFVINGAAATGANADGGSAVYTVFHSVIGTADGHVFCVNSSDPTLASPLQVITYCDKFLGDTPVGGLAPTIVSVQVYSNAVN